MGAYHIVLFVILCLAYIILFIQNVVMTVIAPDLRLDMHLSAEQIGVLGGAYMYAYACAQFCSGIMAARFGPRRVLSLMFSVSALGGVLLICTGSYTVGLAGRALTGMGTAVVMTSAFTVFSRWYPPEAYTRLSAWFFSIGGLGNYIGTAPFSWLNAAIGWRAAYGLVALATLAVSIGVWLIVRDWPPAPPSAASGPALEERRITFREIGRSLTQIARHLDFWRFLVWFATLPGLFYAFAGLWAGTYLQDIYGMSRTATGNLLAMGAIGFIVGNPLLAYVCERWLKSYRLGLGLAGPVGFAASWLLVFRTDSLSLPQLYGIMLAIGMAANAPNAVAYTMARNLFGGRMIGSVGGMFGFVAFIGGACLQVIIGLIIDAGESAGLAPVAVYSRGFVPFLVCTVCSTIAGLTLTETFGRPGVDETRPEQAQASSGR